MLSRGTARAWNKPSPNMITAAEILSASLVLNNGLGFSLPASSFIANTSDGFLGARGNAWATSHCSWPGWQNV
ncbi:hypothetical protein D3C85_1261050 [compost metagenome]